MVEEHVRGAGTHRSSPDPDHPAGAEGPLHGLVGEVPIEEIGDRHRHEIDDLGQDAPVAQEVDADEQGLSQVVEGAELERGWGPKQQRPDEARQLRKIALVLQIRAGVAAGDGGDLAGGLPRFVPHQEAPSVGERGEVCRIDGVDAVAEAGQEEITHDLRLKQAHHVGRGRDPEARPGLLGHGGPAHHRTAFQDEDTLPGPSEVRGADQSVVSAPYDDRVVPLAGRPHGP
jgi:hypothetical protein